MAAREMDKRFDPASYERRWQDFWRAGDYFRCPSGAPAAASGRAPFCIMIPPPNVTGRLHIGHALQSTLQDLVVRWRRMQGKNALWLPGTDHGGVGTELMVGRQLEAEGTSRKAVGRAGFLERTWAWKEQYHGNIREQLDALGASCDWSRERFTLDDGLSRAVREAFVRLHRQGLITRGEYMVNWSPVLGTAISDLEVESRTIAGHLYHIAYPIEGSAERLIVATTRPETMLGDTAIAMGPHDPRHRHLIGQHAILPLVGRRLPLVVDEAVDPEFGSGLVKVTPWHDPADFEIGKRHGLPGVRVIGFDGKMTEHAGAEFAGLDRSVARERVLERLRQLGLLVRVEEHTFNVGHSQRSGEPVEPMVSMQWFLDVRAMAERALAAGRSGELTLHPESWQKTWEHWLINIRPWCISRQLWWGHQIPAWFDPEGRCFVARSREEAEREAGTDQLTQDPDVLDTWFSSGLWPFSTLGWPDDTDDLRTFYPTDVLITGFDILFFWVARMVMMGQHFTGRSPFARVHLTGLVRDASGGKMSKTKGNVIDPLELIGEYGADALRFTLAILDNPGRDIPLDPNRVAGYRAFGNKIWNAVRFALARVGDAEVPADLALAGLHAPERFILTRLSLTAAEVDRQLEAFRFDEACSALYHFFWHELCDWYLEFSKPALSGAAPRPEVARVLLYVLDQSLRLLHPVMPHLTEELWHRLPGALRSGIETLALAPFPRRRPDREDVAAAAAVAELILVVERLRAWRAERGWRPGVPLELYLEEAPAEAAARVAAQQPLLWSFAAVARVHTGPAPAHAVRDRVAGMNLGVAVEAVPLSAEQRRKLEGELEKVERDIHHAEARLGNPEFVARAPAHVIDGNRARLAELRERALVVRAELGG